VGVDAAGDHCPFAGPGSVHQRVASVRPHALGCLEGADLLEILPLVDAIEVYNSRCMFPSFNREARRFAERHDIPGTVGSDAHAAFEVGRSVMRLEPFEGADGMRRVIRSGVPQVRWSPPWFRFVLPLCLDFEKKIKAIDTTN
jgi:hypothetical protein